MARVTTATWRRLLPWLTCPVCQRSLSVLAAFEERDAVLGHVGGDCHERYPVIDDVPRLVTGAARQRLNREHPRWFQDARASSWFTEWTGALVSESLSEAVVSRFDREWAAFADSATAEQVDLFKEYFDIVPDAVLRPGNVILDAGCGAGRWAVQVAARGSRVVAVDAGRSVELTYRNGQPWEIECAQADVTQLPFAASTFDFVYSLGVLHHVEATDRAAAELVRVLRPGGQCLIYLYYALDSRGSLFRGLYRTVDLVRRVLSRSPQAILGPVSAGIAALVYLPLARTSRLLRRLGLHKIAGGVPLSYYADRSFRTMRNDSLDRFGTRLEKRFTRVEVTSLMERAGLQDVRISDGVPYWHAIGTRPNAGQRAVGGEVGELMEQG